MGIMSRIGSMFNGPSRRALVSGGRAYDAGRRDLSEFGSWVTNLSHPDSEINGTRDTVVGRTRDLYRNHPVIASGVDRKVEAVVGANIRMEAQPNYEAMGRDPEWAYEWSTMVEAKFDAYANDPRKVIDAERHSLLGGLTETAYRHYVVDGEALAIIKMKQRGGRYRTYVQLIDPDRLSNPAGKPEGYTLENGNRLWGGVEVDKDGAAVAYHIRNRHPNDVASLDTYRWTRVPRELGNGRPVVVHAYRKLRAEQRRGISSLASAVKLARVSDKYDNAELEAALLESILAFSVESDAPNEQVSAMLAPVSEAEASSGSGLSWAETLFGFRKDNKIGVRGVNVIHTAPGERINALQKQRPGGNYPAFVATILRKIAGVMGISYEQLSQDWSTINYSSARTLLNEIWRSLTHERYLFSQGFLTPIYCAWLEEAVLIGEVPVPGGWRGFYRWRAELCRAEWMGPGRGTIDPKKEADADDVALNQGVTNEWLISDSMGQDYRRVIAGRARADRERAKWGFDKFVPLRSGAGRPAGNEGADAPDDQTEEATA